MRRASIVVGAIAIASCADESSLPSQAPRGTYTADGRFIASGGATGKAGASPSTGGTGGATSGCSGDPDVGAFKLAVDASHDTPTGVRVGKGQRIMITASGTWCWGVGSNECSTADGTPGRPTSSELPVVVTGASFGTLSMRIGGGPPRAVGSKFETTLSECGDLVLFMNDRAGFYTDNSGALKDTIELDD